MQFDQTTISIRERPFADLLDLALRVVWTRPGPWLLMLAVGAVPCAALDAWLFHDAVAADLDSGEPPVELLVWYVPMVLWQLPLATAPLTLYLGQGLFSRAWSARRVMGDFWRSLPQLLLLQVVVRGVLVAFCVTNFVLFIIWPHMNEIILLERNPLFAKPHSAITTMRRNSTLHTQGSAALFGRCLVSALVALLLVVSLWVGMICVRAVMFGHWAFDVLFYLVQFQIAIWLVAGYFAVVRFLGYLDLRIRNEGWEAELLLRAEANRLATRIT